jgi:predicted ribosome quality control (RQC) complex YloA/Tae2 family protein
VDNLVLISVAASLGDRLPGSILRGVRQDSHHRYRLIFEGANRPGSLLISLTPELPWVAPSTGRWRGPAWRNEPFAAACERALAGHRLVAVEKPAADRILRLEWSGAGSLVAELATHGANLILCDGQGEILATARRPRRDQERLAPGSRYGAPTRPTRLLDPFGSEPAAIDALLSDAAAEGEPPFEALRRRMFGVGSAGARLVLAESAERRVTAGVVLTERLATLRAGELAPVIDAPSGPDGSGPDPASDPGEWTLLPWAPSNPVGSTLHRGEDAGQTASIYHEAIEARRLFDQRMTGIRSILKTERRRARRARMRVEEELAGFADPETHRRRAEALLAGLAQARRVDDVAWVADPYDAQGGQMAIQVPPGLTLQQAAERLFGQCRRARRGMERAGRRAAELDARLERLGALTVEAASTSDPAAVERLERSLRGLGVAVGLEPPTRAGRALASVRRPRPEGVRLFTSRDGRQILVGKSGRDNHRLTFRLAGQNDFWFHVHGCPGAHVVVRNPENRTAPDPRTLADAAALAAWYSEARRDGAVEVRWTRRKYVRRPRGAAPGTVTVKRFETIRVKPSVPDAPDEA